MKENQALGIEVSIVTWGPDDYGFGDAAFWMQSHEDMRQAGFFIKTVEDSCENFAVIDQEIIWYGNIHLQINNKRKGVHGYGTVQAGIYSVYGRV